MSRFSNRRPSIFALLFVVLTNFHQELRSEEPQVSETTQPLNRILFGSCIKQNLPMPLLKTVADQKPDLFLFLGDNIYADTLDMEVMREKYATLKTNADFTRLQKTCPLLATWDDHDYGANDAGKEYPKRKQAEEIFLDFWQEPSGSARRKREGVYDAKIYGPPGNRVQIILLDTRYFRSPLTKGERRTGGPYIPSKDTTATMLGEAQWSWLKAQLKQAAEVRIIASSIQCVSSDDGQETWSNLPHERTRFFKLIKETKANGVLIVSGDRHWSELSVETKNAPYPIYDLTSSSINQIHPRGTPTLNKYRALPQTYHRENYGSLEIDWKQKDPTITLKISDLNAKVQLEKTIKLSELHPSK